MIGKLNLPANITFLKDMGGGGGFGQFYTIAGSLEIALFDWLLVVLLYSQDGDDSLSN